MTTKKISRAAAVLLCAGGLWVAAPVAAAAPVASAAAQPATCLSGVRRVQVTCRDTPRRLCVVQYAWVAFTTSGAVPCLKNGGSASGS